MNRKWQIYISATAVLIFAYCIINERHTESGLSHYSPVTLQQILAYLETNTWNCCCRFLSDDSGVTSITSVLPVLSKMMEGNKIKTGSQLFPCLGLEKETTGVLLLARSEEAAEHILNLHRNNQVQRKYWWEAECWYRTVSFFLWWVMMLNIYCSSSGLSQSAYLCHLKEWSTFPS